jgi:hypothetical protein
VGVHQRGLARELRQLAQERTGALGDDRLGPAPLAAVRGSDLAGQDDHHAATDVADARQRFARAIAGDLAEPTHPLDLRRRKRREHLVASRLYDRHGRGHEITRGATWR